MDYQGESISKCLPLQSKYERFLTGTFQTLLLFSGQQSMGLAAEENDSSKLPFRWYVRTFL